jgi:biopolymer transport protein ExbD
MHRPPKSFSMTLNLAPMVDVMMCLIIFFLLATKLATEQVPVELPWAVAAQVVDQSELGNPVTVTVRPAVEDTKTADYVVTDWDGQRIVHRALSPRELEGLLQARAAAAGRHSEALRCVIRADQDVTYGDVEAVLRACGLAQVDQVVFPANKGVPPEDTP